MPRKAPEPPGQAPSHCHPQLLVLQLQGCNFLLPGMKTQAGDPGALLMLNSQIIPLIPGSKGQESVLCLAGKLFSKLWWGRNNKSSRRCANPGCALPSRTGSACLHHCLRAPQEQCPHSCSHLQSWKYLCVSPPGRAGAPGNQKTAAAAGAAKPGAPHARCGFGASSA